MRVFNVIICDDEIIARETIRDVISWNSLGFVVVEMFEDGIPALEYLKNNPVDVVLTDIMMPKLSGVELSKIIYKNYPDIKVIIFSAFRDFEHAKAAVHYHVFDYISKPINYDELYISLENLRDVLLSQKLNSYFQAPSISMQRADYLTEAFMTGENLERLSIDLKKTNMTIDLTKCLCSHIFIKLLNYNNFFLKNPQQKKHTFNNVLTNIIPSKMKDNYYTILTTQDNITEIFAVCNKNISLEDFESNIKIFCERLCEDLKEFLNIKAEYEIKQLCHSIQDINPELSNIYYKTKVSNQSDVVDKIIDYLQNHYMEDITLENLSKEFFIYPNRISILFRKNTNRNYNDFLTDIRINKAKQLLRETGEKISVICEAVGYSSEKYFSRNFKNQVGLSPAEYRKKYR